MAAQRSQLAGKYGGTPQELPHSDLPTHGDIARCLYKVGENVRNLKAQVKVVKGLLENSWKNCSPVLPLLSDIHLWSKLLRHCEKVKRVNKANSSTSLRAELELVKDQLFDIAACICKLPLVACGHNRVSCRKQDCVQEHIVCECEPAKRVPVEERAYLRDQRSKTGTHGGAMQMGRTDHRFMGLLR